MADYILVCVLMVSFCICAETAAIKGLFCQDPDTGKLYAINTTWHSTTFCGNYTCKLRIKSSPQKQISLKVTDVTERNQFDREEKYVNNVDSTPSQSELLISIEKKNEPDIQSILHKNVNHNNDEKVTDDNDRYLTQSEIKSISELLHTVKKSDLEAIVEIYNLAQDIYREMDKAENNEATTNNVQKEKSSPGMDGIQTVENKHISYWYEPMINNNIKKPIDKSKNAVPQDNLVKVPEIVTKTPSYYFRGPLTIGDFGKLPYYYPVSTFQRISSYVRDNTLAPTIPNVKPACDKQTTNNLLNVSPWFDRSKLETVIQPSLLPYPFAHVHYNANSRTKDIFFNDNPWAYLGLKNKKNQPYLRTAYVRVPDETFVVPDLINDMQDVDKNPVKKRNDKSNENKPAAWKMEQSPTKVLDEIRTNRVKKANGPEILSRKVRYEKVGTVRKLNIPDHRVKRDVNNKYNTITMDETEQYEVYMEKMICTADTEPGFFQMGNLSEPYPACCPRRIEKSWNYI